MRYLNKLVLINSASTKFAEVKLDGNIHFIGTQGVGKSTILRAILFFYNANTLRLGISKEKQHFADYYLPFADSYIIYEVERDGAQFCVVITKSQGRVCFRFVDGAFKTEYFVGDNGAAFEHWEKVRTQLDADNVMSSRKIMKFEEYRDIIYGNLPSRHEFSKFTITESKLFHNIPRTIQNVFLNSKLEAEFIKETIIDSLNEQDVHINLQTYQYELKGFEDELNDLEQFRKPRILKQADDINTAHIKYKHCKREKLRLAADLGTVYAQSAEKLPSLEERLKAYNADLDKIQKRLSTAETSFDNKKTKITGEIASYKTLLDTAKIRWEEYQQNGIALIMERVAKKDGLEQESQNLNKEKDLLGAKYKQITQRFDALLSEIKNQEATLKNNSNAEKLNKREQYLADADAVKEDFQQQIQQIEDQNTEKQQELEEELARCSSVKNQMQVQRAEAKHREFYKSEREQARETIKQFRDNIQDANSQMKLAKGLQESLQKKWLSEIESVKHRVDYEMKTEQNAIDLALSQIAAINLKIENSKNSLYGWLNKELKGWDKNIGQVCDEELLFRTDLSPKKSADSSASFFGIDIDLKEIARPVKTVDDYKKEIAALDAKIEVHKIAIHNAQKELEEESDKIKRRNNQRVKQLSDEVREHEYSIVENERKMQSATIQLSDLDEKAKAEKLNLLETIDADLGRATVLFEDAEKELSKLKISVQRKVKAKQQELKDKLTDLKKLHADSLAVVDGEASGQKQTLAERNKQLLAEQAGELKKDGADIARISEIDARLAVINAELRFIEQNRDKVADYKKDKRELFDRTESLQSTKRLFEQQFKQEVSKHETGKRQLETEYERLKKEQSTVQSELDSFRNDVQEMMQFREAGWYGDVGQIIESADPNLRVNANCRDLANQLRETHYSIIDVTNQLSELVTKFLSHFSEQNVFNFNTKVTSPSEYIQFADELSNFIEDNRIAEYEKRVNERYAEIIRLIGSETNDLTSRQGEILRVVTQINRDFTDKNFAGVIKKIELRLGDTSNKVVQVLKHIKTFNDTHTVELGAPNLFSQHNSSKQNKKAVDLLQQLVVEIRKLKKDYISLADSFELQFRVIENDNDTGWVERLVNVGSEGTDVLVKAMINIMLLNVFKEGASKRFKSFKLHCMMDEIGRLHPANIRGILQFANDRNIMLVNGSPTEHDAMAYRHIYKMEKDAQSVTKVKRILSQA